MSQEQTTRSDPRTADQIMQQDMTVEGLRRFCSRHGVTREHGANKAETIAMIMDQAPEAVDNWLRAQGYEPRLTVEE